MLIASIACGFVFVNGLAFSSGQVSTEVSGIISSNLTWTKTGGPYIFAGPVSVTVGAILTIQPGASVVLGKYNLLVNGTLRAQGTIAEPIVFQGGANGVDSKGNLIYPITFTPFSTAWNQQANTGCIIENANLQSTSVYISSSPKIGSSNFNNSFIWVTNSTLNAEPHPVPASPTISNNTFNGAGAYFGIATFNSIGPIANNTISGYITGIEMHSDEGTNVQGNLITGNTVGIALFAQQGPVLVSIKNNTITNNSVGISLLEVPGSTMSATIQYNNIFANANYNINSSMPDPLNAINNWWGTTNTASINQTIYDAKQNSSFGTVTFVPFLTSANTAAPTTVQSSPSPSSSALPTTTPSVTQTPSPTLTSSPATTSASPTPTGTSTSTAKPTGTSPLPTESASPSQSASSSPATSNQGVSKEVVYGVVIVAALVIVLAIALFLRKKGSQLAKIS